MPDEEIQADTTAEKAPEQADAEATSEQSDQAQDDAVEAVADGAGDTTQDAIQPVETDLEDGVDEDEPMITPGMNWFVLRVASNKEDSVRETLLRKVTIEDLAHRVNRILVPTEKQKIVKGGRQRIIEKKLYPGYVFVEMKLEDDGRIPQDVFFLIKETTGVGDFIGTAGRPSPMSIPEIEKMLEASRPAEEAPQVKAEFEKGDIVKIIDGPFENTDGEVDEVMADQGKVRVVATVFGRPTPIELEIWQIEKADEE